MQDALEDSSCQTQEDQAWLLQPEEKQRKHQNLQIVRTLSHHELLHHLEVPVLGGQVEASVAELVSLIHVNALD